MLLMGKIDGCPAENKNILVVDEPIVRHLLQDPRDPQRTEKQLELGQGTVGHEIKIYVADKCHCGKCLHLMQGSSVRNCVLFPYAEPARDR